MSEVVIHSRFSGDEMPRISVIVTVFNASEFLRLCMDTLLSQTEKLLEIVVVNDGSPDPKDGRIVEDYIRHHNCITYVELKENSGTSIARKEGWEQASGEYIGFLDADDCVSPDAFKTLLEAAYKHDADICIANYATSAKHGDLSPLRRAPQSGILRIIPGEEFLECQLKRRSIPFYPRIDWWNKIYKRKLLESLGQRIPSIVRNEGTMSMIVSSIAKRCILIDKPLFVNHTREDSVCRSFRSRNIKDTIESYRFFYQKISEYVDIDRYSDCIDDLFLFVIFNHNMQMIVRLDMEQRELHLDQLIEAIKSDDFVYRRLVAYLCRSKNRAELLAYTAITGQRFFPLLETIKDTSLDRNPHGGKRLTERRPIDRDTLVSVVTVAHNIVEAGRVDHLRSAVESVRSQRKTNFDSEHIIIDGDSTDDSFYYYSQLASKCEIDYWVSEKDSGIFDAMNKGRFFSLGKYCLFLNTDDYLLEDGLLNLYETARTHQADYVFADARKVDNFGRSVGKHVGDIDKVYFGSPYCHQALLCRSSLLWEHPFEPDYKLTMWPFAYNLFVQGLKGIYVPKEVVSFRVGGASTDTHFEAFTNEQTRFKKESIVPRLHFNFDEYEYINHTFRRWNTSQLCVDKELVHSKLNAPETAYQARFCEASKRLLAAAGYEFGKRQVITGAEIDCKQC